MHVSSRGKLVLGKSMCRPFRSYLRSAGHLEEEEEEDEDDDNEGDVAAENEEEDVEVESEEEEEEEVHLSALEQHRLEEKVGSTRQRYPWEAAWLAQKATFTCRCTVPQKPQVMAGTVKLEDKQRLAQEEESEAKRLAIMMMKKREKYLYQKIMFGKRRKIREANKLAEKRKAHDDAVRSEKKAKRTRPV